MANAPTSLPRWALSLTRLTSPCLSVAGLSSTSRAAPPRPRRAHLPPSHTRRRGSWPPSPTDGVCGGGAPTSTRTASLSLTNPRAKYLRLPSAPKVMSTICRRCSKAGN
uniref:Uncharacterized protein n=1 Tax=Aegilops tauschii TaxID=37682 RepID=M8BZV0_AEGTA